jgi:hypothetical protein
MLRIPIPPFGLDVLIGLYPLPKAEIHLGPSCCSHPDFTEKALENFSELRHAFAALAPAAA